MPFPSVLGLQWLLLPPESHFHSGPSWPSSSALSFSSSCSSAIRARAVSCQFQHPPHLRRSVCRCPNTKLRCRQHLRKHKKKSTECLQTMLKRNMCLALESGLPSLNTFPDMHRAKHPQTRNLYILASLGFSLHHPSFHPSFDLLHFSLCCGCSVGLDLDDSFNRVACRDPHSRLGQSLRAVWPIMQHDSIINRHLG